MAIPGPIPIRGFSPLLPAESGLPGTGTVEGRISREDSFDAFYVVKDILRRFDSADGLRGGFFSIQIAESSAPNARILFDTSVELGLQTIASEDPLFGSGIGLYAYFPLITSFNSSWGKFKTRIVGGEPVRVVIQSDAQAAFEALPTPVEPAPARPGPVILLGRKVTSIVARMPSLPARATSFTLQVSDGPTTLPLEDSWMDFEAGLLPGNERTVEASFVGASDADRLWFRLKAINNDGESLGPSIRDAEAEWNGIIQMAGYAGWEHGWIPGEGPPSPYHESGSSYLDPTGTVSIGGFIQGRWGGPIYRMVAPAGAVIRVISDAWGPIPSTIRGRYTFSVSYLPGEARPVSVQDARLGKTWAFYGDGSDLKCSVTRRRGGFDKSINDVVITSESTRATAAWRIAGTLVVAVTAGTGTSFHLSRDDGATWAKMEPENEGTSEETMLLKDTTILLKAKSADSSKIYIIGKATAFEVDSDIPLEDQINQGDIVRVVMKWNGEKGRFDVSNRTRLKGDPLPDSGLSEVFLDGATFFVVAYDEDGVRWWESTDELQTLKEIVQSDDA